MEHYAGLDVSLKEITVCVVDGMERSSRGERVPPIQMVSRVGFATAI